MTDVRNIRIDDFDYPLPEKRIALHPLEQRDACKLLVANSAGRIFHRVFSDLPLLLHPDTLIIANETKVIRARMEFMKDTGARIEIFLLEPLRPHDYVVNFASTGSCSWACLVGNRKRWKEGPLVKKLFPAPDKPAVTLKAFAEAPVADSSSLEVRFEWDDPALSFAEIVELAGNIPIPPYLKRESEEADITDYQTVYSNTEGSVAAPTAGLHFTPELISRLKRHGDEFVTVTLHVGAGTFQPVKSELIADHAMHTEWISVSRHTINRIISALENGRDILAVGTTSVRTLESLPYLGLQCERLLEKSSTSEDPVVPSVTQWMPYEDRFRSIDTIRSLKILKKYLEICHLDTIDTTTSIMIAPGFRWRIVNRLVTNFHQPKSTLLLLVSSFLGDNSWRKIYEVALAEGYRFLSYGDACLFSRGVQPVELPAAKSMVLRAATIYAVKDPGKLHSLMQTGLCDDSEFYIRALQQTLDSVEADREVEIYIGEGAAPLRFLTAFAASLPGSKINVTCAPGLRKRPVQPLIDTLLRLGADIQFNGSPDEWKMIIRGRRLEGGLVEVDSSFTSQYLSALLLASPLWVNGMELPEGFVSVSRPYLDMTLKMMAAPDCRPEPDWSAAAFFYEYSFISGKKIDIAALTPPADSLQGDSAVCETYRRLGVSTLFNADGSASLTFEPDVLQLILKSGVFEFDFTDYPDMVPSLAVALCYRKVPFRFTGVGHLRFKECDRLAVIQKLLLKVGYEVSTGKDTLEFSGKFKPMEEFPVEIDPHGDHRMAMAFYPLEILGMATVEYKGVVRKSFPNFYQQF